MISKYIADRAGMTHQWCPSDTVENYKVMQKNGVPNYSVDDFSYKFNSHGFRCDEFTEHSDLPILFMGCSLTEGIGLPIQDVWPMHILSRIRSMPKYKNCKIPFWSIALGGTGTDVAARELVNHIDRLKPKYIFYHLSSRYRREIKFGTESFRWWAPNFDHDMPKGADINKLFVDEYYASHQTYRSLCTINLAARLYNSKVFIFDIDDVTNESEKLYSYFPDIKKVSFDWGRSISYVIRVS